MAAGELAKLRAVVLSLLLAASACGEEKRTELSYTEATEQNSMSLADTAARPQSVIPNPRDTFAVPTPGAGAVSVSLVPVVQPALSGSATLEANGWSTKVTVNLEAQPGAGGWEGSLRTGTCDRPGPTLRALNPVSTDSLGKGAAASIIDVPLDTLVAKRAIVVYGRQGRIHSCGESFALLRAAKHS